MLLNDPKITVLMPAYNAGPFIHEAIVSVLEQTFADFELLIINDGSTDDTEEIIRSFNDPRIVVISQENKGISAALNLGLEHARANLIARFDADDVCYPNRLQVQFDYMSTHPEYSIVGSAADYMDAEGHYVFTQHPAGYTHHDLQKLQYKVCPFIHSTVMYKKEVIMNKGGYNEFAYTFEDHFLWVNILNSEKAANIGQPLIKVRLNPASVTIDEKWHKRRFREIKLTSLKKRSITEEDGIQLAEIGEKQYASHIKRAAYYSLCGKKFLVNNYQPVKARELILRAISIRPFRLENYLVYTASYLPQRILNWLNEKVS